MSHDAFISINVVSLSSQDIICNGMRLDTKIDISLLMSITTKEPMIRIIYLPSHQMIIQLY